jgi:hypothetical protein
MDNTQGGFFGAAGKLSQDTAQGFSPYEKTGNGQRDSEKVITHTQKKVREIRENTTRTWQ